MGGDQRAMLERGVARFDRVQSGSYRAIGNFDQVIDPSDQQSPY